MKILLLYTFVGRVLSAGLVLALWAFLACFSFLLTIDSEHGLEER